MPDITEQDARAAISKLGPALDQYRWIQDNLRSVDVSTNTDYQRRFDHFYRVRRGKDWRVPYFALMERSKNSGISFGDALHEIQRQTGKLEASFTSKLVATIDPARPVWDQFVLGHFGLKPPAWGKADRALQIIRIYRKLCDGFERFVGSDTGKLILNRFDETFPDAPISSIKKIDLVLWQVRE